MQQKSFKNILSFITVIVFLFLAVGSKVRSIHCGAFYETTLRNEDVEGGDYYILLENGTKVYYDKMSYTSGLLLKHQFKVDGKIYKTVEVKGYASSGIYYTKLAPILLEGSFTERLTFMCASTK